LLNEYCLILNLICNLILLHFFVNIINKKHLRLQHKHDFLASGTDKMCRLEDLRISTACGYESHTKRTLERWTSKITWLKSSHQANDQLYQT